MKSTSMVKAIIFDCFGVLYGGSLETLASQAPPERRKDVYDINSAKDYGYINYQEYLAQIGEIIGVSPEEVDRIMCQHHVPNNELIEYAKQLKAAHKTALLSNIGDQVIEHLFDGKVDEYFTEVFLSYKEGIAKPNPDAFRLAAARLGVNPEDCVMIDDLASNCEGAELAGMQSIQHITNESTIAKLTTLLAE